MLDTLLHPAPAIVAGGAILAAAAGILADARRYRRAMRAARAMIRGPLCMCSPHPGPCDHSYAPDDVCYWCLRPMVAGRQCPVRYAPRCPNCGMVNDPMSAGCYCYTGGV